MRKERSADQGKGASWRPLRAYWTKEEAGSICVPVLSLSSGYCDLWRLGKGGASGAGPRLVGRLGLRKSSKRPGEAVP